MDNSWRPKDWDALDIYAATEHIGMEQTDLIEAGAGAVLDALIDILYVTRPQVERWPDELLKQYSDSLDAAREELERRHKDD